MDDIDTFITSYENHRKAQAEANERNKALVFDVLAAAGITTVTAKFDGEGDQGQLDAVTARAGDKEVSLPATPVTIHQSCWPKETLTTTEQPLSEAVETLCYDYLEQKHGGWENNEGGFGSFVFDVAQRSIELEFNGRFTDIATSHYTF
jgi:hypothetical protein